LNVYKWKVNIFILISAIFIAIFSAYIFILDCNYNKQVYHLEHMDFTGNYQTARMETAKELSKDTKISIKENNTVTFRVRFNRTIEQNEQIYFLIHYLKVNIKQNDKEIYSFGNEGSYPPILKCGGKIWGNITSEGIDKTDEIEITLYNPYGSMNYTTVFEEFMKSFYIGDSKSLLFFSVSKNISTIIIGFSMIIIGVALFVIGGIFSLRELKVMGPVIWGGLCIFINGIWFLLQNDAAILLYPHPVFICTIYTLCLFLQLPLLTKYMLYFMNSRARKMMIIIQYVSVILLFCYMAAQIVGMVDAYQIRGYYIAVVGTLLLIATVSIFYEIIKGKDQVNKRVMRSMVVFVFFGILELFNYVFEMTQETIFHTSGYVIFILAQCAISIKYIEMVMSRAKQSAEMEKKLLENNVSIMLSQIHPHFLYNSISCIQMLCRKDPQKAELALGEFADFLRGNMDSLKSTKLIPFDRELRHIKAYLYLEKIRFGDMLNVEYDIQTKDFYLPPLTIQPIVENASKYGVGDKETGGTIFIGTREEQEAFIIVVADDGIGFDPNIIESASNGRSHIGLKNVREHIESLCGGALYIESKIGEGTTITIKIPKQEVTD